MINLNDYPLVFRRISDQKEFRAKRHGSWAYTFVDADTGKVEETLSTYLALKKYKSDKKNKTMRLRNKKGNAA